jgi:hypothetical protein
MAIISLKNINVLIVVMVKCGVLFEVRSWVLNISYLDELRLRRVNRINHDSYFCKFPQPHITTASAELNPSV